VILVAEIDRPAARPDAIREIFDRGLVALIVRNVFPADTLAAIVARIEGGEMDLPEVHVPSFRGPIWGRPLVTSGGDLGRYLDDADRFRAVCGDLFPLGRIHEVLAALAGGRLVSIPTAQGRRFVPATIRVLIEGDRLPLHFENTTFEHGAMQKIALDRSTLMSFYVPLALPDRGGELRIYEVDWKEGRGLIERMGGDDAARAYLLTRAHTVLRPGIGDLLLFDGGRHYHEVTPVGGRPRWTLGGFLALSSDQRSIHFWS